MSKRIPARRRLTNLIDVRTFLSGVINRLNRDEIDGPKAGKLGYLCQIISRVMEQGDLERRVADLEEKIN